MKLKTNYLRFIFLLFLSFFIVIASVEAAGVLGFTCPNGDIVILNWNSPNSITSTLSTSSSVSALNGISKSSNFYDLSFDNIHMHMAIQYHYIVEAWHAIPNGVKAQIEEKGYTVNRVRLPSPFDGDMVAKGLVCVTPSTTNPEPSITTSSLYATGSSDSWFNTQLFATIFASSFTSTTTTGTWNLDSCDDISPGLYDDCPTIGSLCTIQGGVSSGGYCQRTPDTFCISFCEQIFEGETETTISIVRYNWGSRPPGFSDCSSGGHVTSHDTTLTVPSGGTTLYLCAKDSANDVVEWSGNYRWENTLPTLSASNSGNTWYNTQRSAVISASDSGGSGLDQVRFNWGSNAMNNECTGGGSITSNGASLNAQAGGTTLFLCARDNAGNVATWSGNYKWENTLPTCGLNWDPNPSPWKLFGSAQQFTLSGSTDTGGSGINVSGGTCTTGSNNGDRCNVIISDYAGNTRSCQSPPNRVCAEGQTFQNGACETPDPINGACGTRNKEYASNLNSWPIVDTWCAPGTRINFNTNAFPTFGNPTTWTCQGLNGGENSAQCTATRAPADCDSQSVSWSSSCSATLPNTNHGGSQTISNAASGFTGSATYTCNNGIWDGPTAQTCSAVSQTYTLTVNKQGSVSNSVPTWLYDESWKIQRSWAEDGVSLFDDYLNNWVWFQKEVNSNLGTGWGGILCGASCTSSTIPLVQNREVNVEAVAADGQVFSHWGGDCLTVETSPRHICVVRMDSSKTITAHFSSSTPPPSGCPAVSSVSWGDCLGSIGSGGTGTITSVSNTRTGFSGSATYTCSTSNTWTLNSGWTCSANPVNYQLAVTKTGTGIVTSNPVGINCGTACSATYSSGTSVTLTANPGVGYSFSSWGGACSGVTSNTCTVTMSEARSVSATFTQIPTCSGTQPSSQTGKWISTTSPSTTINWGFSPSQTNINVACQWGCEVGFIRGDTILTRNNCYAVPQAVCGGRAGTFSPTYEESTWESFPYCDVGTPSSAPSFPNFGTSVNWNCNNDHGSVVSCTATRENLVCGDGIIAGDKQCDFGWSQNDGNTPSSTQVTFTSFTAPTIYGSSAPAYTCDSSCQSSSQTILGPYCGDNIVQGPPITGDPILEQCDGTDSSNICRNAGEQFRGNTLSCTNACYFDSSNCMECSDSQHVQCSYESPQYQAGTIYSDKVSSDYICRNDGTGWAWRSHSEGLGAIQNTVREQCGNGIDTNCNAHLHFARNGGNTLNLHRYIDDSQGEFNVIPDIDAFDPHCFSNVTGVVNVDDSPLANATISLFIRDINNNDQLFRKINSSNDGTFSFDPNGIPSTEYKIVVSKEGYFSQVKLINLTYESQNNFEFDLLSGSCQSDCTRGDGFCHANCDGIAGCSFKEGTKQEFDLVQQGIYRIVDNEYYLTCDTHEPNPSFALTAQLEDNVQCEDGKTLSVDKRIVLFNGEPAEVLIYVCR